MDKEHVEPVVTSPAEDPDEEFLKGQRKRQAVWNEQQAARRAKVVHTPIENKEMQQGETVTASIPHGSLQRDESPPGFHGDEICQLKKKLEQKSRACELLAILQQQKRQAAERDLLHESFCKASDNFFSFSLLNIKGIIDTNMISFSPCFSPVEFHLLVFARKKTFS